MVKTLLGFAVVCLMFGAAIGFMIYAMFTHIGKAI